MKPIFCEASYRQKRREAEDSESRMNGSILDRLRNKEKMFLHEISGNNDLKAHKNSIRRKDISRRKEMQ
jgi:hypothetical protein